MTNYYSDRELDKTNTLFCAVAMDASFHSRGSIGGAVLGVLLLILAAYGLALPLVGKYAGSNRVWKPVLAVALGLNVLAAIGVGAGLAGWLGSYRSLVLLVGCTALGPFFYWHHSPHERLRSQKAIRHATAKSSWLVLAAAGLGLVTLGPALCYPTGWDELVYHHELPRRWLADGWPAFYSDLPFSGFPSLGEILFWLAAPLESAITPRLVVWASWAIGITLVFALVRRRLAPIAAAALTAAFALSGASLMISANCYVESILFMNAAALLWSLETAVAKPERVSPTRAAVIVGVLAGGAAAVKLTGLAVAVLPCFWYAALAWSKPSACRTIAKTFATYCLVAAIVALPFYLRPWLLTGNPFYPYYAGWFTSDAAVLEMSQYHHALGAAFGIRGPLGLLAGPLLLAYDFELYDGAFGWQFPGFILFAAIAFRAMPRRRRPFLVEPALSLLWLFLFWFLTAQQARFAIPAALCLVLLAAMGLRTFHGRRRTAVIGILLAATVISVPWRNTGHYFGSWMTALGVIGARDYVNEATYKVYLPLVAALEMHTPADAKVMLLFEHRLFYLPRRSTIGTPFFQQAGFTPPELYETPASLMRRLSDDQITHIVITNAPAGPDQVPGWFDRFEKFLPCFGQCVKEGKLQVIWQSERYILLAVPPQA